MSHLMLACWCWRRINSYVYCINLRLLQTI
jgi:hypothetical protein